MKNTQNNFFRHSNVELPLQQENQLESTFNKTHPEKFSGIAKLKKIMTLRQNLSSRDMIPPHKRLTEPLMIKNNYLNPDSNGLRKTRKNNTLKFKDYFRSVNTLENGKNLERNEFLKTSIEKIEWEKLSHSQLKMFIHCYIKDILNLGDEKLHQLLSKYILY